MRDKQIDEIANDLNMHCCSLAEQFCGEMSCNACISNWLYYAGYRKSTDLAREIFEEIEEGIKAAVSALQFENNPIHRKVKHEVYSSVMRFVKSVEEKYTEG